MEATVYRAGTEYRNERDRRSACLRALIDDHASLNAHIVLDEDETMVRFDNQKLIEYTRAAGCRDTLRYEHTNARTPMRCWPYPMRSLGAGLKAASGAS